jgi:hypothetical protein
MIGWTELGVVKAWINSDFSVSHPEEVASSEQEMVCDLLRVFEGS